MTSAYANSVLDLLRLLVVPVFAWAAYTDVRTRRIPNKVWPPLFLGGLVLFALTVQRALEPGVPFASNALPAAVVSLGVVAPVAYLFWLFGGFGGADAKALLVLSLLFPIYPVYEVAGVVLPLPGNENPLGSFAFTILTNTVLAGVLYPLALSVRNAVNGEFALPMFLGKRVDAASVDDRYGTLMGRNDGMTAGSLDLDALRMYLRWRGESLDAVRSRADELRDPGTLPANPNDPTDGNLDAVAGTDDPDGGDSTDGAGTTDDETADTAEADAPVADGESAAETAVNGTDGDDAFEDAWGAEAFLEDIDGDAYGTSPESLRDGLDVLAASERVWVSPGIPFVVPMFVGLVLALTVGDLVTAGISLL
ncbi:A24 family peptidase [Halorubellus litoreus]|uniref:Prepilin peptidase n=1 Tax=Halorubellus litoreus TaxID=755308 RepID=A0ABD5VPC0_9EURY